MNTDSKSLILYATWTISLLAMLGSLYFSNVLNFPPCVLCWYQRIAMYPLVLLIPVAILRKDNLVSLYVLPLSLVGFLIGLYHNLLYYQILPESAAPCAAGVSCTTRFVEYFGFLTIPLMSLLGFIAVITLMIIHYKLVKRS